MNARRMTDCLLRVAAVCREWIGALFRLLFPKRCAVCGVAMQEGEEAVCLKCNMEMPRTNFHLREENPVERMFWGKMSLERATAYLFYHKDSAYRRLIHLLKYNGRKDLGEALGRMMAAELAAAGFFGGVDVIVPVPLHPRKQRARGYNQSECIARGISAATGIEVALGAVTRVRHTETQTRKSAYERWANVEGIFCLHSADRFVGRHVLVVDDVLTTGATTTACADVFRRVAEVRISVLALAVADA